MSAFHSHKKCKRGRGSSTPALAPSLHSESGEPPTDDGEEERAMLHVPSWANMLGIGALAGFTYWQWIKFEEDYGPF